jgi:hypothetical protein
MNHPALLLGKALRQPTLVLLLLLAAVGLGQRAAFAQATVDGTLNASEGYGSPLATQTINTGFGDNTSPGGTSSGGSELDAVYGVATNGYLYLFIAGNVEANGNNIDVFIATGQSGGQQVLQIGGSPLEAAMNGSAFSPGFVANVLFTFTNSAASLAVHRVDLSGASGTVSVLGSVALSGGAGNSQNVGGTGLGVGFKNTNTGGVNGSSGTAANAAAANAVSTGLELGIPLSALGNPTGSIKVLICINGSSFAYLSNQFLPGLSVGTGNLGGGGTAYGPGGGVFNFGSAPAEYLSIQVGGAGTNAPPPSPAPGVGATVPYQEYEAENATTTGTVIGPSRAYLSQAAEASGRRAVSLNNTGQYVEFTLAQAANSIVVRFCMPDGNNGAGDTRTLSLYTNGFHSQNLTLTSTNSWVYGAFPFSNTPGDGSAHHFYDEVSAFIGELPAGTKVRLQKDSSDTASYYLVDLADFEEVPAASTMPAGFLSITNYGATPNDGTDDSTAFQNAVSAAESQGKGLWIPPGQFNITRRIDLTGVTLQGAGPWYSLLQGTNCNLYGHGGNIQMSGFKLDGLTTTRTSGVPGSGSTGIEGVFGAGSVISNVWLEHTGPGFWVDGPTSGLLVTGCRIRNTFADGLNLAYGVANTTVQQCNIRNTGDDSMAMWSDSQYGTVPDRNNVFQNNTIQLPLLANGIGIYGGTNNAALNNWIRDTVVNGAGIQIANRFTSFPLSGRTVIQGNQLDRTGSYSTDFGMAVGALWLFAYEGDITGQILVTNNSLNDSTYQGILLSGSNNSRSITGAVFDSLNVSTAGTVGIQINTTGSGCFESASFSNTPSGSLQLNNSNYQITYGLSSPPATSNLYVIGNVVTYRWPAVVDLDGGGLSYHVRVGTTPGGSNVLDAVVASANVTVTNVIGNTLYAFVSVINNGLLEGPASGISAGVLLLDPNGDQDGDGMSNAAEDSAGTDPLDPGSVLRIVSLSNNRLLTWSSVSNKTYQVTATTNLAVSFSPISGMLTAAGPTTSYSDSAATNALKFYRVTVLP